MKHTKKRLSSLFIFILIIGVVFTTACSKKTIDSSTDPTDKSSVVFSVDDTDITLKDLMYYIYPAEAEGSYYEQMSLEYFNTSYWDMDFEEGITMRDYTKQFILDNAIMYEILYMEALKQGYSLTEEEITAAKDNAATIIKDLEEEVLTLTGFTEELISKIEQKLQIGMKYSDKIMSEIEIDEDAIASTISYEEYRQYNTENIFVSTTYYDEDGTLLSLSKDEIKEARKIMEDALKKVQDGKSFSEIEEEEDLILVSELNFIKGDGSVDKKYQEAALSLENDQIADGIIEGEEGFYIIKMLDNDSKESYEAEIENAIQAEEDAKFMEVYDKIAVNYKTEINDSFWNTIKIGTLTIPQNSSNKENK